VIALEYEMTYTETIEGPLGPTDGAPEGDRLCWKVANATLIGPRIDAKLALPGSDWIRLGADGVRRMDLRAALVSDDDEPIFLRYDNALIAPSKRFLAALELGLPTQFSDQYMRIAPRFEVGNGRYSWLMKNLFLGRGRLLGTNQITYDIYRVL
jgi:Protein of unknown function (DUF3237)